MSSYPDKPTLEERLQAYQESEDFERDVSELINEYQQHGKDTPSEESVREEVLKQQKELFENQIQCETQGHLLIESNADAENGRSDLSCERCGFSQTLQW